MNGLLYDITGLVGIFPLPESDDSSENVSNESSEDKDSEKNIIVCAIWTSSPSLVAYIRIRYSSLNESL